MSYRHQEFLRRLEQGSGRSEPTVSYRERARHMRAAVEAVEWSGYAYGQGSGVNGNRYAACPVCHGLKEANHEFRDDAVGHRDGCKMAWAVKLAKELNDD